MDKSVKHFFDTFHHGKSLTLREVGSHFHIFLSQWFGDKKTKGESLLFFELKIFDSGGLFKTSRIKKNSKELTFSSNVSHHSLAHKTLTRTHNLERRTHTHSHTQSSSGTIIPFKLRSLRGKKVSC